uniref:NADH dehydrogenase subunit 6 n=1 Tax=Arocatus melanocephalus TaxID=1561047 RepID=UPI002008EC70|nr:NADH dehydrogenase subunit 6 [Arocatus melanocephalus]UPI55361.1 NADH dehydrogenase subunit 6 [Arocatus melanocephalus]
MNIIMSLMVTMSILFMFIKHPLSMVITIIMQSMFISMLTGMMMKSFWFSYIIMIIMMSGMLVLFIYMASIASNEKFKFSFKVFLLLLLMFLLSMLNINSKSDMMFNMTDLNLTLNNLFNSPTMLTTIMMVMYLLYSMITISKIININEGPLRIKK